MQLIFRPGDTKTFTKIVKAEDCAVFFGNEVHPLYATFALARDAEWCCRLFVLDMKEDDEEGIGTFINIEHVLPAPVDAVVTFTATIKSIRRHEIVCDFTATVNGKLLARGSQGQKILKRARLNELYKPENGQA